MRPPRWLPAALLCAAQPPPEPRLAGPKMHKTASTTLGGILARAANKYRWQARLYGTTHPLDPAPRFGSRFKKAGGAEQYNANKKYAEAVTVAAEACADDTKGQTCYICTQALHWKTKEGLVRGCACRGTAGFAHVSCLAEQAKILAAEAEENNLGVKVLNARLDRWHTCSLCEQEYHGVVACALGWACWKMYVGRPETDQTHGLAMNLLGNGLSEADRPRGGRVGRARGQTVYAAAHWRARRKRARRADKSCDHVWSARAD